MMTLWFRGIAYGQGGSGITSSVDRDKYFHVLPVALAIVRARNDADGDLLSDRVISML